MFRIFGLYMELKLLIALLFFLAIYNPKYNGKLKSSEMFPNYNDSSNNQDSSAPDESSNCGEIFHTVLNIHVFGLLCGGMLIGLDTNEYHIWIIFSGKIKLK